MNGFNVFYSTKKKSTQFEKVVQGEELPGSGINCGNYVGYNGCHVHYSRNRLHIGLAGVGNCRRMVFAWNYNGDFEQDEIW